LTLCHRCTGIAVFFVSSGERKDNYENTQIPVFFIEYRKFLNASLAFSYFIEETISSIICLQVRRHAEADGPGDQDDVVQPGPAQDPLHPQHGGQLPRDDPRPGY
jgi:hypothetical protein